MCDRGERAVNIVTGAIAGLAAGCIVGWLKNSLIWMRYLKKTSNADPAKAGVNGAYIRSMISLGINVLTLAAAFFLRDVVPFHGMAFLIGTAAGLSIMNKVLSVQQKKI